jgi:acyl carrier protein
MTAPHHYLIVGLDLTNPAIVEDLVADWLRVSEVLVAYTADNVTPETVHTAVASIERRCPVPLRLVEVARIPRDPVGAVDAAQLLSDTRPDKSRRTVAPPANDIERRIALIWSDTLDRPEIGRDESFFELGGNSLRAARLLAQIDRELAVRITTQELYENPTVAGMAVRVGQK